MLTVVTPLESAERTRKELTDALGELAEAQSKVARAIATLNMFETNFRMGYYKQKDAEADFQDTVKKAFETVDRANKSKKQTVTQFPFPDGNVYANYVSLKDRGFD